VADLCLILLRYRKGVSFLSRIIGSKKKDQLSEPEDDISEPEASRMSVDTSHPIGFIPRHAAPSKYLKVRAHNKKVKTFDRVFLAQELEGSGPSPKAAGRRISGSSALTQNGENTGKAVWALMFSKDGKYLAAAGQDRKVRVWAVISTPEEREDTNGDEEATPVDAQEPPRFKAPVFQTKPIQVYEGHTGSILDLSWSKVCILNFRMDGRHHANLRARITSFSPRQWTKQYDYGISLDRNACVVSSTVIL
jgi:WD40 repeat protein